VLENNSYTNLSLEQAFSGKNLSGLDRAFATALSYGTITRIVPIDAILSRYSKIPLDKMEPWVRTILRIGAWQIFWSEKVPDSAACNESVNLAKTYSNKGAAAFVNGLLRTLVREKSSISQDYILHPKEFHLRCSLPRELAGYFKKWFGEELAVVICGAMDRPSGSTVRVNTLRTSDEALRHELERNGCVAEDAAFMPHAFSIRTSGVMMEQLPSFQHGEFIIQDEAAMLVCIIADPKPGQLVLDLCSAPGGKTCHMAEQMKNEGRIIACDINPSRLSLVKENADRLGIDIILYRQADACTIQPGGIKTDPKQHSQLPVLENPGRQDFVDPFPIEPADLVLADVPCSGLGVLGKKPDIRIHMTHERMTSLYPVQRRILENAAAFVKPGGFLVYSTCTLNPAENEQNIGHFLEVHAGEFEPVDISDLLPAKLKQLDPGLLDTARNGMVTLFPDRHLCDGFFVAKLRRSIE
jgi:16S rRNA (cytosine967-C5)-methyltransferase